MATNLTAARQLVLYAAREADAGRRVDMEAGMAKLFGYSTEFDVERYFRDTPMMIVGEGTNEIQRNVIAAQLVARGGLDD